MLDIYVCFFFRHGELILCSHVGVAVGGLVDVGVVDDEEDLYISVLAPVCEFPAFPLSKLKTYVLGPAEGDTSDARNSDQVQLLESLAGLFLLAGVDNSSRASGESLAELFSFGFVAGLILFLDRGLGLGLVVGELFNSRVGHFDDYGGGNGG